MWLESSRLAPDGRILPGLRDPTEHCLRLRSKLDWLRQAYLEPAELTAAAKILTVLTSEGLSVQAALRLRVEEKKLAGRAQTVSDSEILTWTDLRPSSAPAAFAPGPSMVPSSIGEPCAGCFQIRRPSLQTNERTNTDEPRRLRVAYSHTSSGRFSTCGRYAKQRYTNTLSAELLDIGRLGTR